MNNKINIIGLFFLILTVSCRQNLEFDEILENEKQFELKIYPNGNNILESTLTKRIDADSKVIINLKAWLKNNAGGWESSNASWSTPDIYLIGDDFRLLIFKDFVVVSFTDKSGEQNQFTKQTDKSDFNFLTEK